MRLRMLLLSLVLTISGWSGMAHAAPAIQVLDTYPAGEAVTLPQGRNFNLRLSYDTDKPVGIWITPYFRGKEVPAGTSPSPRYTGKGETLAWFFFLEPGQQADEIRIRAGNGSREMPVVATYRVQVTGGSSPARASASPWAPTEPEWVDALQRRIDRQVEAAALASQTEARPGDAFFLGGFMLLVAALCLTGLAAPVWAMRRWRGGWRLAAAAPAALLGLVILNIAVGTAIDPTSHNLWPFEVAMAGMACLGIIAVLAILRRVLGIRSGSS